MQPSGLSADELFKRGEAITYDDFTILNTKFSKITKKDVSLKTSLGKGVDLAIPIIGSPMDSMMSPDMAIALDRLGGIGTIHHNHKDAEGKPSIDKQIEEIEQVKRAQNGFIANPVTVSPEMNIAQVIERGNMYKLGDGPISTFPVTENGESNGILVGLLRRDDYFRGSRTEALVRDRMLKIDEGLICERTGITLEKAREVLWGRHIKSLPIIDNKGNLAYLVTKGDIEKNEQFPNATVDENNRLRVLFAISTWPESYERLERGFAAGADGVIVDTSQGFTRFAFEMLKYAAKKFPDKLLIGGNISTAEACVGLARLGIVDAYRNGQGPGSICTTADAIGIGRAAAIGIYECSNEIKSEIGMVTIADGGLRTAGDIFKALALGSGAVMLGGMLAGHRECPGEIKEDEKGLYMEYWGMGSNRAKFGEDHGRIRDYGDHEEGIVKRVKYKGELHKKFPEVIDALLHSFEVSNYKGILPLQKGTRDGSVRFERRSIAALVESKPHD